MDKYIKDLDKILSDEFLALRKEIEGQKLGVLFSGGVDSSLIAKFAEDAGLHPVLYSFGTEKSKDRRFVFDFARDMKMPLIFEEIENSEIENHISFIRKELVKIGEDPNPMQVALAVGVYLIGKRVKVGGIKFMICGQGSDELFAGYKKYEGLKDEDLQKSLEKDIESVMRSDIARDTHMLSLSGIKLFAPYTDKTFIDYALKIPLKYKVSGDTKKIIIRKVAEKRGLPGYICNRPKNAMQYSSGIQKVISKVYKAERKNG